MRKSIKNTLELLPALGCTLDHADRELHSYRWRFTHPAAPGEFFTVNHQSSEVSLRTVVLRAKVAAGLASSDSLAKRPPKQNARAKLEREAERNRIAAARTLAAAKDAEERARRHEAQAARGHREIDRLIRGPIVGGSVTVEAVPSAAMLTVAEVADQTGVTDKAVLRAIESGRLEAYQCGQAVKVKGADVREWLAAS